MIHESYLPKTNLGQMKWMDKFSTGLTIHGPALGVTPAIVTSTRADADFLAGVLSYLNGSEGYVNKLVTFKDELLTGDSTVKADIPAFSEMPTHVAVLPGILNRATKLVTVLKTKNLTPAMIQDMGLEGNEKTFDFDNIVVNAKVVIKSYHAYLFWNHQGTDAVDIKCDYGDTLGMIPVGRITSVNYMEPRLPASGVHSIYKYLLRYVVKDEQVGNWTEIISIAMKGM